MTKKETCISEEVVQTSDGTRLLTTYKSPLYDWDGSVMGTVGIGIDITQENAYKQQLIAKTKTLETLFTTMDCGILCHSVDGSKIISINAAALKILGYESQEEMVAAGFHMVAPSVLEEDMETLKTRIQSLQKAGDSINVAYRVQHDNGDLLHIMGNIKLIEENGELFYQRFLLDCTTQRLNEEALRKQEEQRQMELLHALSIDYNLVCFFDLDTGKGTALRISDCKYNILDELFVGELYMEDHLSRYIDRCVYGPRTAAHCTLTGKSDEEARGETGVLCQLPHYLLWRDALFPDEGGLCGRLEYKLRHRPRLPQHRRGDAP